MDTFLVLGYLPGTNIQISFQAWLMAAALLMAIGLIKHMTGYKMPVKKYTAPVLISMLLLFGRVQYRPFA